MAAIESTKTATGICIQENGGDPTACNDDTKIGTTMPTTASKGAVAITRGTFTAGTNGIGGTAIYILTGDATLSSCTITATGTVAQANINWTYATGGGCTKAKTGV
ncbi:type IV secretion system prepilin [Aromatoleum toluclasticum]|uniref:type IV secretion system prepilin n=1 Tax=Aromatoleum toluclasticum TaxID=92003 RepID=UPI0038BC126E